MTSRASAKKHKLMAKSDQLGTSMTFAAFVLVFAFATSRFSGTIENKGTAQANYRDMLETDLAAVGISASILLVRMTNRLSGMATWSGCKGVKPGVAKDWPKYLLKNTFSRNNNTEKKTIFASYAR